ncbi:putative ABC-type transport system, periplasmic component/surface lipoprotein [Halobacteroides halobius DSM 5150]|uniref:Putative ABC-type transport system, periplasmic component/surface lipoprotein n=1 Tax=Halobacteroides halobius (strain ATCC 35273 / DSM 5150 / MD-1) TaxID=748449 RepID=L0K838_HALHC|nr:BMP family ABC transporter substrate-binding protein [Halobacteroides halobius]AGB40710.1 putative ABC-type transport system, periplasmic component/surface lipoprotein [Halobacteroides halobius DSM 5150]
MKKKSLLALSVLLMMALVVGCAGGDQQQEAKDQQAKEGLKVGIVLSSGGKGDKSFNDSALRGLDRAKEEGIIADYKYIEPKQVSAVEKGLRFLAKRDYDLVIGVGFMQHDAVKKVSSNFSDTNFAIIDSVVKNDNVASLTFKEHEGSFLAGALAALMTTHEEVKGINQQQVVGFLGGMDVPLIHKFELGYTSGVKYINKTEGTNVNVKIAYAGNTPAAFNNPAKGKEIALAQYGAGADIIYHASGGTGGGLFKAAKKTGHYAIGVDSDQDWVEPGHILTSMQKRVDNAVYKIVKKLKNDNFTTGLKVYGLKEGGVALTSLSGLGPMTKIAKDLGDISEEGITKIKEMKARIPDEVKEKIKEIRQKIIAGEIKVPNYLKQNK